jgi:hypothetical protein
MKLGLGIHIVMHLVFFGKTGLAHSPLQSRQFPLFNRPPLDWKSKPWPLMAIARRASLPSPPLLALFKHNQSPCHTPFERNRAPTPPLTHARAITVGGFGRRAIAGHPSSPSVGEVSLPLLSCFFFAPVTYSSINSCRRTFIPFNRASPPSSSIYGRRRRSPPSLHPRHPILHQLASVW